MRFEIGLDFRPFEEVEPGRRLRWGRGRGLGTISEIIANFEFRFRENGVEIRDVNDVVFPRRDDKGHPLARSQVVRRTSAMLDMAPHQVDATGSAGDDAGTVAVLGDEGGNESSSFER